MGVGDDRENDMILYEGDFNPNLTGRIGFH